MVECFKRSVAETGIVKLAAALKGRPHVVRVFERKLTHVGDDETKAVAHTELKTAISADDEPWAKGPPLLGPADR